MTTGSLGLRSASYGSLQQHLQNSSPIQITPPLASRKASKMFKEKDSLFHRVFKFAPRKKVGMLLLCVLSIAAMLWVFYVGKGEAASEVGPIHSLGINTTSDKEYSGYSPTNKFQDEVTNSSLINVEQRFSFAPPPPPKYFTGYTLPPGNPCETFTLPPPPADKKRTGPRPCPVCYLPVDDAIALMPTAPSFSPVIKELTYIHEKNLVKTEFGGSEFGGSEFGGYPSLKQRLDSYDIKESMCVHCGFVKGDRPGHNTGFDIDVSDLDEIGECRGVVVASAIFGAYDIIQQPKNISEKTKQNVCFVMFVDEETEKYLRNTSDEYNGNKIGLWRVVVVHNLPYTDPRRNGKIPKLLLHRLFPNVRYSLWIDGKLELVVDPFQILERFLWRQNVSFAISRHYRRFDVFLEAEANKAGAKYDNASIDFQIEFYKMEGLTPFSDAKLPITSDVPEGCVIIREHNPISNLFCCLWFNEVDRFTSRDQISFSTVRDKIREKTNYTINMFWDCERRNFVVQGYHRDILEHWAPPPPPGGNAIYPPPPPQPIIIETPKSMSSEVLPGENIVSSPVKVPGKRGRERRSRRHRKEAAGSRDNNQSYNTHFSISRHFSSNQRDGSDDGDGSEDDDDEEEDWEGDDDGGKENVGSVEREYTVEEKEREAAAIGYKVNGRLERSDWVFKHYEPVFAVIQIGSHQFKVSNGDCIYTEKLKFCDVHDKLILNKVLMLGSKTQTMIGRPILPDAAVHAIVEEHALDAKVIIFKKKRRKNYRRKNGHRQELTKLRITDIQGIEKPEKPILLKTEKSTGKKAEKVAVPA